MREFYDDFNDIEFDDNEIIERLMLEMEHEERRLKDAVAFGPRRKRRFSFDDGFDDDIDDDYDDLDDEDDDYDDEDYDDLDDDRY